MNLAAWPVSIVPDPSPRHEQERAGSISRQSGRLSSVLPGCNCHLRQVKNQTFPMARFSPGFPVEFGGFGELHAPFFTERRTRGLVRRCEAGKPGPPDFLWNLVASGNFMRLSLRKGARAASSGVARQESRVPRISCGIWWLRGTSCAFLYGKAHAQPRPALRGRKAGSPGFPVEFGGFGELHAPFFTERRTRGLVRRCEAGNRGREIAKKCTVSTVSLGKWLKCALYALQVSSSGYSSGSAASSCVSCVYSQSMADHRVMGRPRPAT